MIYRNENIIKSINQTINLIKLIQDLHGKLNSHHLDIEELDKLKLLSNRVDKFYAILYDLYFYDFNQFLNKIGPLNEYYLMSMTLKGKKA